MSSHTTRLDQYKLHSEFTENAVTHRTIESDPVVHTTWLHERTLGAGGFGEVFLQREKGSGQLRAVKVITQHLMKVNEIDAMIDLQDVSLTLETEGGLVLKATAS